MDGNERERQETARILGEAGYSVDTAATEVDVVTLLNRHAYDLVLADLCLAVERQLPPSSARPAGRVLARVLIRQAFRHNSGHARGGVVESLPATR